MFIYLIPLNKMSVQARSNRVRAIAISDPGSVPLETLSTT